MREFQENEYRKQRRAIEAELAREEELESDYGDEEGEAEPKFFPFFPNDDGKNGAKHKNGENSDDGDGVVFESASPAPAAVKPEKRTGKDEVKYKMGLNDRSPVKGGGGRRLLDPGYARRSRVD